MLFIDNKDSVFCIILRTVRDEEPKTATSTSTQLLSSVSTDHGL